ncbi:MAG: flavodoxin family protein [Spirochaetota bacterium]
MHVTVVGVSGSPRQGATLYSVKEALAAAADIPGVKTELIDLRGKEIHYCIHCDRCIRESLNYCPTFRDSMDGFYESMLSADGIIIGSPVYQMTTTALLQAFFNRLRPIALEPVRHQSD